MTSTRHCVLFFKMSNWQRRPARQGEAPHSSIWEVNGGSGACFPYSPMYLTVSMDPLKSSHWITPVVRPFCIFKVCFGFSRERESAKVSDCSSASLSPVRLTALLRAWHSPALLSHQKTRPKL